MPGSPNVLGNCRFKVDIGGGDRYIKEVDTVAVETPATPYNAGMSSQGKPGTATFVQKPTVQQSATELSLTVVAESKKTDMFDWYDKSNNQGQWKSNVKDVSIRYYDESNTQALVINLTGAYPTSYSLATASSDGQDYLTEVVKITCTSMKLKPS